MKILFYDTKKYDRDSFEKVVTDFPETEIDYLEADLSVQTARLAKGMMQSVLLSAQMSVRRCCRYWDSVG